MRFDFDNQRNLKILNKRQKLVTLTATSYFWRRLVVAAPGFQFAMRSRVAGLALLAAIAGAVCLVSAG
jgi:hypothetical protein